MGLVMQRCRGVEQLGQQVLTRNDISCDSLSTNTFSTLISKGLRISEAEQPFLYVMKKESSVMET